MNSGDSKITTGAIRDKDYIKRAKGRHRGYVERS